MFRFVVVLAIIATVYGFGPARFSARSQVTMSAEKSGKFFGAALIASSMFGVPAFAVEGAGAKLSVFGLGGDAYSSPFVSEDREDPIYSPYSPFGNGEKAVYNARKGGKEEVTFWKAQFAECVKRTEKVPGFAAKSTWSDVQSTLTTFAYNMRTAMLYLAENSATSPKDATAAAKAYFADLNDITEFATKKKGDLVLAAYDKSVKDLATFKSLLK
jgi:hypothetical protein